MKSRKGTVRDLALAVGLAGGLVVLLLVCTSRSAPPIAAASPAHDDLWPVWTSTEPTHTIVTESYRQWNIEQYSMTITFYRGAVTDPAVFTFTPKTDLKLPAPLVSTAYMFEIYGTYLGEGGDVSLAKPIDYELIYEESGLGEVSEHSLGLHYIHNGRWYDWPAQVNTGANRITWKTQWTGQFGFGGYGSTVYLPTIFMNRNEPTGDSDIQADE